MIVLGIDPGLTGAMALMNGRGLVSVTDIPTMMRGAGTGSVKNQVDPGALYTTVRELLAPYDRAEVMVVIEMQQAMGGGMNASAVFSLGLTAGIVEGVVAARGLPHELVPPAVWKKAMGLSAKGKDAKEQSMSMAKRYYPDAQLHLAKHHNRAEAILIGRWALEKYH